MARSRTESAEEVEAGQGTPPQKTPTTTAEDAIAALQAELAALKAQLAKDPPARKKQETEEEKRAHDYWNEPVEIRLFKDSGKYADDVTVCINGKVWKVQRGKNVTVPRKVKVVLDRSLDQDEATALMMDRQEREFIEETRVRHIG